MSVYIANFLQTLKKSRIVINLKHSIIFTIEGNVFDIIYVGELEVHTVLMCHCATYSLWPAPLYIALYLALAAKTLDIPGREFLSETLISQALFISDVSQYTVQFLL